MSEGVAPTLGSLKPWAAPSSQISIRADAEDAELKKTSAANTKQLKVYLIFFIESVTEGFHFFLLVLSSKSSNFFRFARIFSSISFGLFVLPSLICLGFFGHVLRLKKKFHFLHNFASLLVYDFNAHFVTDFKLGKRHSLRAPSGFAGHRINFDCL